MKRTCTIATLVLTGAVCLPAAPAVGDYLATWDAGDQGWFYYYDEPQGVGAPIEWRPSGGHSRGYVRATLGELTDWVDTPDIYYPAYAHTLQHANTVDFDESPFVSVYIKDDTPIVYPDTFKLHGGRVHMWIGEWYDPDGPGGAEEQFIFYRSVDPFDAAITDEWTRATLDLSDDADWTLMASRNLNTPVRQLMTMPQQWGFCIVGASKPPAGMLAFDTLEVVPEPAAATLLACGASVLARRRRR